MKIHIQTSCSLILPFVLLAITPALRAETVTGTVVGPDGQPVSATVYYVGGNLKANINGAKTNKDGTFTLDLEQPKLTEGDEDERPAFYGGLAAYASGFSMGLTSLQKEGNHTLKLTPLRVIKGVLRDEKGATVAGATVQVSTLFQRFGSDRLRSKVLYFGPPAPLQAQLSTKTDAKGNWEIAGVPNMASAVIAVEDDDFLWDSIQVDAVTTLPRMLPLRNLVARRAGSIKGRVLDASGKPVAGAPIWAIPQAEQDKTKRSRSSAFAKSAADGTFTLKKVTQGAYNVLVCTRYGGTVPVTPALEAELKASRLYAAVAIENVPVVSGQSSQVADFHLVKPAILKGRVLDRRTGLPLARIAVGAYGKGSPRSSGAMLMAYTDSEGRYEISVVPGSNALYAIEKIDPWGNNETPRELPTTPVTVIAGQTKTLSIWLDRRFADLEGQIVDEKGQPIVGAELSLKNQEGRGQSINSRENGKFSNTKLPMGTLNLESSQLWTLISPQSITLPVAVGAQTKIVVRANPVAKVSGRVVDKTGKPLEDVQIRIAIPFKSKEGTGSSFYYTVSNERGEYSVDAIRMPDALKLKLDYANKTGYKLATPAALPASIVGDSPSIRLGDTILETMGSVLKGQVLSSDGQPVVGAIVRASGDNYSDTATTDAKGQFSLTGQPEGKSELIAAQGRSFGRTTKGESTTISLKAGEPMPSRDVKRAITLFRTMAPTANKRTIEEVAFALAPHAPAAALELLTTFNKVETEAGRIVVINALTDECDEASIAWAKEELPKIEGTVEYITATTNLGLLLAQRQTPENYDEVAIELYKKAQSRLAQIPATNTLQSRAQLAALASRLKLPEAPDLVAEVLEEGSRKNALKSLVIPLSKGSGALATQTLEAVRETGNARIYLYKQAIQQVVRYDAVTASQLLEKLRELVDAVPEEASQDGRLRGRASMEYEWAFAAKSVMRALPTSEVELATNIARRVKGWHRVSALAMAAEFGSNEQRLAMARKAIAAEERGEWMEKVTVSRMGALVAQFDQESATTLFMDAVKSAKSTSVFNLDQNLTDWGFYAAAWNPAQARMALELDWEREQKAEPMAEEAKYHFSDWRKGSIVKAMSAVDLGRALELAQQLSEKPINDLNPSLRAGALAFMGQLLLQEPAKRRLMVIAAETGFDK